MLPQPKRWRHGQEWLAILRNVKVRKPGRATPPVPADQARLLDCAIGNLIGRLSADTSRKTTKCIKLLELQISNELSDGTGKLSGPESYHLVIEPEKISLVGTDLPALKAGLVSLSRLVVTRNGVTALPTGKMTDWPDLPLRGFHLDLTCQSLRFDYACSFLERLAGYKYNAVLLEWGDKFPYQGHRILSHPDAFSQREVSQLLELAESLGLVVIPLVQTLGHVEFILRHPQFAHLSEVPGENYQLATSNPESLVLTKQLVDQLIESHPNSPYVHLGADETTQLGQGASVDQVEAKGKSLVWVEYMNVICRHVQARGRTPIVWDDMLLGHPQALNRFTRDCLLMHWNYSATSSVAADYFQPGIGRVNARAYGRMDVELRERYGRFWSMDGAKPPKTFNTQAPVAYLQEAGFRVILAPAVRSYGDSYSAPRIRQHIDNCFQMALAAARHRSLGVIVTNWSVRRTPLETTLPLLVAAAEAAWNGGEKPGKELDAALAEEMATGPNGELIGLMDTISRPGLALFNGVGPGSAWDRRHDRWGIAPLISRLRKTDLAAVTASGEPVRLARRVQRDAAAALRRLAKLSPSQGLDGMLLANWRYAAREMQHKAGQWLFFWQVARLCRVDRGSATALARQGALLLEDMRRCQREFKRTVGPSLTSSGLAEEIDVHFGGESRLVRRLVRTLRAKQSRAGLREQLAGHMGLPMGTAQKA